MDRFTKLREHPNMLQQFPHFEVRAQISSPRQQHEWHKFLTFLYTYSKVSPRIQVVTFINMLIYWSFNFLFTPLILFCSVSLLRLWCYHLCYTRIEVLIVIYKCGAGCPCLSEPVGITYWTASVTPRWNRALTHSISLFHLSPICRHIKFTRSSPTTVDYTTT